MSDGPDRDPSQDEVDAQHPVVRGAGGGDDGAIPLGDNPPGDIPNSDIPNSDIPNSDAAQWVDLDAFEVFEGDVEFAARPDREQRRLASRRRRRRRRVSGAVILVAGLFILAAAGWTAYRLYEAKKHLTAASTAVSQLQLMMSDPSHLDNAKVATVLSRLTTESEAARIDVDDPIYSASAVLPWIGDDLAAVRAVARTVHGLSADAVPPLLEAVRTVSASSLVPRGGAIQLAPIVNASSALSTADQALTTARQQIGSLDTSRLAAPLATVVRRMATKLDKVSSTVTTLNRLAHVVPAMLGATGTRRYLVVFQNLAEPRSTGGIFGSYLVLDVDNGSLKIEKQGAASRTLGIFDPPVSGPSAASIALYTDALGRFPADVNLTPDFPTAAQTFVTMYVKRTGQPVDGVIAVDPVALSYLLAGSAPIKLPDGFLLSSSNLVKFLLSDIYTQFPDNASTPARDVYLAAATKSVFARIIGGGSSPRVLIDGLERASNERRFLVWSSRKSEEFQLDDLGVSGRLSDATARAPQAGVYVNDGTGAKLGYYLAGRVALSPDICQNDGTRRLGIGIQLKYSAPSSGLPPYVLGLELGGKPAVMRLNVLVVAPVGGQVLDVWEGSQKMAVKSGTDRGRAVGMVTVEMKPGTTTLLSALVTTPPTPSVPSGTTIAPTVITTPGIKSWTVAAHSYPACRLT